MPADAAFADERHGLTERLNHHGDQKVAAKLDEISGLWRLGDNESFLSDRIEERSCAATASAVRPQNEQLTCGRDVRAPKDRRRDKTLAGFACAFASASDSATLIVLDEMWIPPFGRLSMMPPLRSTTPSTALSFASMVITAPSRQASAILATALAPCAISGSAFALSGYRRSLRDRP